MAKKVRTDLTDQMKARIKKVKDANGKHIAPGSENDDTRLINSWIPATEEEHKLLEKLVVNEGLTSSADIKDHAYETFRCFTTHSIGSEQLV